MTSNTATMKSRTFLVLVTVGGLFGSAFLFMKVLVDEISPIEIVAGRLALGAIVIAAVMAMRGRRFAAGPGMIAKASLLALVDSVVPFTLVAWAETRIDSGVASVLVSTMPVFTVLITSVASPGERLAPVRLLGIPLGFLGVISLTGGDVLHIGGGDALGQLAVVGAAACYGGAAVYARVLLRTEDALSLTGTKLAAGALVAGVLVLVTQGASGYARLSAEGAVALVALGVLSTAFAFTLYLWLVGTAGSVYASLVTYVVPVFGLLLGWAVLGEPIGLGTLAGATVIVAGIATTMFGPAVRFPSWQVRRQRPKEQEACA